MVKYLGENVVMSELHLEMHQKTDGLIDCLEGWIDRWIDGKASTVKC